MFLADQIVTALYMWLAVLEYYKEIPPSQRTLCKMMYYKGERKPGIRMFGGGGWMGQTFSVALSPRRPEFACVKAKVNLQY